MLRGAFGAAFDHLMRGRDALSDRRGPVRKQRRRHDALVEHSLEVARKFVVTDERFVCTQRASRTAPLIWTRVNPCACAPLSCACLCAHDSEYHGAIVRVRAIGVLKMIDGGEVDNKIVAVPTTKIDPTYDSIKEISDLPKVEQDRLQAFFRVYKQLPDARKVVEVGGFDNAEAAKNEVAAALKAYSEKK